MTVMSWNVENFFAPQPADEAAYDAKPAEMADVIRAAAPDLLAFEICGDPGFFLLREQILIRGFQRVVVAGERDELRFAGRLRVNALLQRHDLQLQLLLLGSPSRNFLVNVAELGAHLRDSRVAHHRRRVRKFDLG